MLQTFSAKRILGLVLILSGCFAITAIAQPDLDQRSLAQANGHIPRQQELEDLVNKSALIVRGQVSQTEFYWQSDERGRHIYTKVTIQPITWLIGKPGEEPLMLEVVGGTVDEMTETVSSVPAFRDGEESILFLTGSPYLLVDGHRGKLNVYEGKVYWGGAELSAEAFLEVLELITAGLSPESVWKRERQRLEAAPLAGAPVIKSITPNKASAGTNTQVTIIGSNFGADQGTGKVEFFWAPDEPNVVAYIVSWSNNTRIVCTVPVGEVNQEQASAGSGPVTVKTSSGTSKGIKFLVTFGYGGCQWPSTSLPVKYYINENAPDCTGVGSAIRRAASTWKNAAGGRFSFEEKDSHNLTVPDLKSGKNEVMWGSIPDNPTAVAVTYSTYNWQTNILLECDLVFNSSYSWSTDTIPSWNRWDVESVALHELGHWLKLKDLYGDVGDGEYDVDKVMYGFREAGETRRVLHADDVSGIKWIYPAYIDIGLRVYDGTAIISIACEPAGTLTSPLRIAKNGIIYGIVLVDPSDPDATGIRVQTSAGVKALRKY